MLEQASKGGGDENSVNPVSGGKGCSWVGKFENARFELSEGGSWGGNGNERMGMGMGLRG